MRMSNFIAKDAIIPALSARGRDEAIVEMLRALQAAGRFPEASLNDIVAAVLRREQLGSTGIGRGVAIPHSRHASIGGLVGTVALHRGGLAFDAIDEAPVDILVLVVSPQDQPGPHLRALENVVQAMKSDEFLARLRACSTADEIWAVIAGE